MTVRFADSAGKKVVIPPPHLLFALFYPICKWPFSALSRFFPSIKLTYPLTRSAENHVGAEAALWETPKSFLSRWEPTRSPDIFYLYHQFIDWKEKGKKDMGRMIGRVQTFVDKGREKKNQWPKLFVY